MIAAYERANSHAIQPADPDGDATASGRHRRAERRRVPRAPDGGIRDAVTRTGRNAGAPLLQGRVNTWACAVTYTIGTVNFLFEPGQVPHLRGSDLCTLYGVSQSAGSAKSREIMRLLRIVQFDPRWCLPSRLEDNPLVWMIQVNGIVVDIRTMPKALQEEAHRLGLIPFVPSE